MQTLWSVLRKDTTGVDTASDADLDYRNTEVEFFESLAAVDITCRHNGLRCRYRASGHGRRYKRLGLKCTCLERRYKRLGQLGVRTRSGAAVCDTKSHRGHGGA